VEEEARKRLREIFVSREKSKEFFSWGIEKAIEETASELEVEDNEDSGWSYIEYFRLAIETFYPLAIQTIHTRSGSEIEKIFLCSLMLNFLKNDPLNVRVTPPSIIVQPAYKNATEYAKQYREYYQNMLLVDKSGTETDGKDSGFYKHLDTLLSAGEITKEVYDNWRIEYIFAHRIGWYHAFQLLLQPKFPDIKVEGRSIRPDIYIWRLDRNDLNIIVECDGYQFHSDQGSFTQDRRRDRVLKKMGFEVLRYSGSEIYRDPINTAYELFDYLQGIGSENENESSATH